MTGAVGRRGLPHHPNYAQRQGDSQVKRKRTE